MESPEPVTVQVACAACGFVERVPADVAGAGPPCKFCRMPMGVPAERPRAAPRPDVACVDCGRPIGAGLERCSLCLSSYVAPTDARLRLAGGLLAATAAWTSCVVIAAAVLHAGGLRFEAPTHTTYLTGKGPALVLALPTIGLLHLADRLRRFRGAPDSAGAVPAIPLPFVVLAVVLWWRAG